MEAMVSATRTLPLAKQQLVIQDHVLFFLFNVHIERKRGKSLNFQTNYGDKKVGKAERRAPHRLSERRWWGTESSVRYVKSMGGDGRIFVCLLFKGDVKVKTQGKPFPFVWPRFSLGSEEN